MIVYSQVHHSFSLPLSPSLSLFRSLSLHLALSLALPPSMFGTVYDLDLGSLGFILCLDAKQRVSRCQFFDVSSTFSRV